MTRSIKNKEVSPVVTSPAVMPDIIATIHGQTIPTTPRAFKTGSKGFFGVGKLVISGRKYQCQVQLVEIGSKPKA